jgi:hypothetical protein
MGGVITVFICVIGSIIWGLRVGKKRRTEMGNLVEKLGLQFSVDRNYQMADRYAFLDKLRQGSNRYTQNIISGTYQEHEISAFDYHYETHASDSNGKRQTTHHNFSFFILTLEKKFPELTIAKESFFSKISPTVGYDNIDFKSHEFSKMFTVRSKDKTFAYDFCNAQMIDYLLGHPNSNIEIDQNLLALGFNRQLKTSEIEQHLNQLIQARSLLPNNLFTD